MNHPFKQLTWKSEDPPVPAPPSAAAVPPTITPEVIRASLNQAMAVRDLPLFNEPTPQWTITHDDDQNADTPETADVDWTIVRSLQSEAAEKVGERVQKYSAEHGRTPAQVEVPMMARGVIDDLVQSHANQLEVDGIASWDEETVARYAKAVWDSLYGLGRMQALLEIPDAENVIVYGSNQVVVEHNDGRRTLLPAVADSDEDLMEQLQHMAQNSTPRRAFDASHLDMTLMLADRFRIHAVSNEISGAPSVVIRQHLMTQVSLGDLVDLGLMPSEVAQLLDAAVQAGLTIVVAGEQGAGKTTLLRALIHAIPQNERFATLETDLELFAHKMPGREHTLTMFARDGQGERDESGRRAGDVEVSDMVRPALRQGLGRIIVGEVRGVEASAMFQAMQSGTGTMSSIHSPNASQVPIRLADVVAQGRIYGIAEARRQVALSVDIVVFIRRRDTNGTRKRFVEAIDLMEPGEDGLPSPTELYRANTWTGETILFTPGQLATDLEHLYRGLDRLADHP